MNANPSPSNRRSSLIILCLTAIGSPIAGFAVANLTDNPWLALGVVVTGELLVLMFSLITETGQELLGRWTPKLANWIDTRVGWVTSGYRHGYLQHLVYLHRYASPEGLPTSGPYTLELEQIFVELRMGNTPLHKHSPNPIPALPEALRKGRQTIWDYLQFEQTKSLSLVIIGPPGSGKTTLLKHITLTVADAGKTTLLRRIALSVVGAKKRSSFVRAWGSRVPILIFLRDHAEAIADAVTRNQDLALVEVVRDSLATSHGPAPPGGWLERLLAKGRCLVLLDGLDEVADPHTRQRVVAWVQQQMKAHAQNRFIITSRLFGYLNNPLSGVMVLEVLPFSDDQVRRFLHTWYTVDAKIRFRNADPGVLLTARNTADDLIRRLHSKPALWALTINPLLLTMIATVHRHRATLPDRRVELYNEICEVFLGRRQQARGQDLELSVSQKREVLQVLSYHMMCHQQGEISRREALNIIAKPLSTFNHQMTGEAFLKMIENQSGLLLERENNVYSFAHLTFQEYLAAAYVATQKLEAGLRSQITVEWWHETILLYAGLADATPIIDSCITIIDSYINDKAVTLAPPQAEPQPTHQEPVIPAQGPTAGCLMSALVWVMAKVFGLPKDNPTPPPGHAEVRPVAIRATRQAALAALAIALGCREEGVKLSPNMRTRLDELLDKGVETADLGVRQLIIEARLNRRLRHMRWMDETHYIDTTPVTHAEYQLFLNDLAGAPTEARVYHQPDHWSDEHFPAGQGNTPVVGVRPSDAEAFCDWLTNRESDSEWRYRLPTIVDIDTTTKEIIATNAKENNANTSIPAGTAYWVKGVDGFRCDTIGTPDMTMLQGWLHQQLKQDLTLTCALALVPLLPSIIGGHTDNASEQARAQADELRRDQASHGTAMLLKDLDHAYTHASSLRDALSHIRMVCRALAHDPEARDVHDRVAKYVEVLKDARTHINALMAVLAVHGGEQHRKRTRTIADMLNRVLKVDAATPRDRRQFLGNREHDLSNARNEIYEEADKLLLDVGSACSNAWIKASAHAWAIVNPHKDLDNRTSALANLCALTLRNHFTATNANADSIAISLLDTDMFADNGQHPNSYTSNLDHAIAFTHDIHAQECTKSYITKNPSDLAQELTDATYADLALATTLDVILNRTSAHHAHQSDELRAGRRHVCLCALMLALKLGEGARRKDSEQESLQQQYRTLYLSLALLEERIARNLPACESIWIVKEKNS